MPQLEPHSFFIEPLEASGLPYCITGSVASGVYGEMRYTADIDFVLLLKSQDLGRFVAIFPEEKYYVPPIEVLLDEVGREQRGMFNLIHQDTQFKADVFLAVRDPLQHWALKNRRQAELPGGGKAWIAPPEYVILRKLEYFREGDQDKHIRDIRFMLACTDIDRAFLESQVARLGLEAQWRIGQGVED